MKDVNKTREELIQELAGLRQQIAEYEALKAEQESSLENWERMFDSIGDLVAVIDKDFRFVRVNRALANVLKVEPEELIGKTCYRVTHGSGKPPAYCPHTEMMETGRQIMKEVFEPRLGMNLQVSASPLLNKKGEVSGSVHIVKNITERKQAEEALRESEEQYRSLFEASPISLWEEDHSAIKTYIDGLRDSGVKDFKTYFENHPEAVAHCATMVKVIDVNKATLRLYDARDKEEFRNGLARFFCEESYDAFRQELFAIAEGKTDFETETVNQTLTGDKKSVVLRWSAAPGYEETYSKVIVSIIDITERKRIGEALCFERDKLTNILNSMDDGVCITNQQYDIDYVNRMLIEQFGPVEGRKCYQYFHDRKEVCPWCVNEAVWRGKTVRWEWYSFKNQKTYDLIDTPLRNLDGSVSKLEIFRDITERKRAEKEYRTIIQTAMDGFFLVDTEGRLFDVNEAYCRLTGYSRDELLKMKIPDVEAMENAEETAKHIQKIMKVGFDRFETRHKCKDGHIVDVEVAVNYLKVEEGRFFVFLRDITEHKQAEKALKESEEFSASLLNNAPNPIIVFNPDTSIRYVNPELEKLTGFSADELIGRKSPYPWWRREQVAELSRTFTANISERLEARERFFQKKNGELFWVEITRTPVKDDTGQLKYNVSVWVDITERKRAEQKLKESEEFRTSLLDNAPTPIIVVNPDTSIRYVNAELERLTGYTADEVIGRQPPYPWWRPEAAAELSPIFAREITQGIRASERLFQKKNGELFWVEVTRTPIEDSNGQLKYTVGIWVDITERRRAEELFRSLAHSAPVGIYILQDGKFQYANPEFEKLTGYGLDELKGMDAFRLVFPDDRNMARENAVKMLKGERLTPYEYRTLNKAEEVRWIVETVASITYRGKRAVLSNYMDITERKQMEATLRQSEQAYRTIFETTGAATAIVEADATVSLVNSEFERLFGYSWPEIEGKKHWAEFISKKELKRVTEYHRLRLVDPTAVPRKYVSQFLDREGNIKDVLVAADIISGTGKTVVSLTDITERKRVEDELQKSRAELHSLFTHLQSVREEERRLIAREIHDELGQVLTALKMDLSWLDKRLPKETEPLLNKVQTMSQLIDTTIRTVKRISTELRPAVLDDFGLLAAMEWQAEEFENRTGIKCEFGKESADLVLEQKLAVPIFRVFQETLTNVARHANATKVKVTLKEAAGKLRLQIRDNGRGITEEQISSSRSFGLIGMRERTHSLGGEIKINGIRGKGTRVTVSVPLKQETPDDKNTRR